MLFRSQAEQGFKQAIELNPRYGVAHYWYSCYLAAVGRTEESVVEIARAHELAPLSLMTNANVGRVLYFARRYDEAIAQCRKTLDIEPTFFLAHAVLGLACTHEGMHEDAVSAFQKAMTFSGGLPYTAAGLGYALARAGKKAEAQGVLADLTERSRHQYVPAFCAAMVQVGLGNTDEAFAWLARAYEERSNWLAYAKVWPLIDDLRSDARFTALLRKVGVQ